MASQPLNTDIKVYRRVRVQRDLRQSGAISARINRLNRQLLVVPAEEDAVETKTRDTNVADLSSYMGEARFGASRGFPIVVGLRKRVSYKLAKTGLTSTDFPVVVGQDAFIQNTDAGLSRDLHQDARDLTPDVDMA